MPLTVGDKIVLKGKVLRGTPTTVKFQILGPSGESTLAGTYDSTTRKWESPEIYLDLPGHYEWRLCGWRASESDDKTSGTTRSMGFDVETHPFSEPSL